MAGTVKKLQFSEGTDVGAPTDLSLQTSTSVILAFVDDAAYVTSQGAAANGSVYLNSTIGKFRYFLTDWRNAVPESDLADPTKRFLIDSTGNTTGVTSTLDFNNTASRIYTYPNFSGTLATLAGTESLSNKTLVSPILTTAIIGGGTLDVSGAGALAIGASVGANNLTLGGATSTVVVAGDLLVQGTTVTLNTANLDVEDKNITLNVGGNDASAIGAGLTVTRTTTNGTLLFDSALTSKWKLGLAGSEVEVADISSSQTFSNKSYAATTTFLGSTTWTDASTPSNPSAGSIKIYSKAGVPTYLNSAGVERTVANTTDAFSNPMTTAGDIVYGAASGLPTRLPGAAGILHGAVGSAPSWSTLVNADVSASAAIDGSKIVPTFTAIVRTNKNISADINPTQATAFTLAFDSPNSSYITSPASAINQDLPTTGVLRGQRFRIIIAGATLTNTVTIRASDTSTVDIIAGAGFVEVEALQNTPTASTHWKVLDVHEEISTTFTFQDGSGSVVYSANPAIRIARRNKMVTYTVNGMVTGTKGNANGTIAATTLLPARFRPSFGVNMATAGGANGATTTIIFSIETTGAQTFLPTNTTTGAATNFLASTAVNMLNIITMSYTTI